MDTEKTRRYYDQLTEADVCDCAYCQNYIREIRAAYPELAGYLDRSVIDIEKPFETIPVGIVNGMMFYSGVQYIVMGAANRFMETGIGSVRVCLAESHPITGIRKDHFVIEISPVYLPWTAGA